MTTLFLPEPVNRARATSLAITLNLRNRNGRRDPEDVFRHINDAGLGVLKRVSANATDHLASIRGVVEYSRSQHPSGDEMTNLLLILENVLTTGRDDIEQLLEPTVLPVMTHAALGLRTEELAGNNTVGIISGQEQLEGDVAVSTFIAKYGNLLDDPETGGDHPLLHHQFIARTRKVNVIMPSVRNQHLEALLREQPESHTRIFKFLSERGWSSANTAPVSALREYLDTSNSSLALSDGWL